MIWKTECGRIKNLLALSAGRDIDEEEAAETRRHIAHCPHCRDHQQKVVSTQGMLEQIAGSAKLSARDRNVESIWPQVRARLLAQQARSVRQTFSGWLPVGALAAACLAILVVAGTPQPRLQYADGQSAQIVQPVMNIPGGMPQRMGVPRGMQGVPGWEGVSPDNRNWSNWQQSDSRLNFGTEPRRIAPAEADQDGF